MKRPFILFLFMLTLCISVPSAETAAVTFSDTQGHWAENYIYQTAGVGLIHGYPDGTFRPDQTITRAEFITILAQFGQGEIGYAESRAFKEAAQTDHGLAVLFREGNVLRR